MLEFGMSKNNVLETIPAPLYVESGNSETSVWVYNVRTIKVKSSKNITGIMTPEKTNGIIKHQSEIDNLYLTFDIQDKLLAWGDRPYDPNYTKPYYDCSGICNGEAYIDECGVCQGSHTANNDDDGSSSFKLELNVEGTQDSNGNVIIKGVE